MKVKMMDWNWMKWNGMNVFFSAQYRMILQKWMCLKIIGNKMRGAKKKAWWLDECLANDSHSFFFRYDLFPLWFVTTSWRLASTTIAGIVSSKGTLSSSDLRSKVKNDLSHSGKLFEAQAFHFTKTTEKIHKISQEQDPIRIEVQASSPTSTQRQPIMSTDQPYLKHNLHVKILRNERLS